MASQDDEVYNIDRILDIRIVDEKREFLIRWSDRWSSPEYDTWEPEENLIGCGELIENFLKNQKNTPPKHSVNAVENSQIGEQSITTPSKDKIPIRKRRQPRQSRFWTMVSAEEGDLRDPFWKKVEEGTLQIEDESMTDRVKRRRTRTAENITTNTTLNSDPSPKSTSSKKTGYGRRGKKRSAETAASDQGTSFLESKEESQSSMDVNSVVSNSEIPISNQDIQNNDEGNATSDFVEPVEEPPKSNPPKSIQDTLNTTIDLDSDVSFEVMDEIISDGTPTAESSANDNIEIIQINNRPMHKQDSNANDVILLDNNLVTKPQQLQTPTPNSSTSHDHPRAEQDPTNKQQSPADNCSTPKPLPSPNGQWRPLLRASPIKRPESNLVIDEEPTTSSATNDSTPSTSGCNTNTAQPAAEEFIVPGLPLPITKDLSYGDFFKSELSRQNRPELRPCLLPMYPDFVKACHGGDVETASSILATTKISDPVPLDLNRQASMDGSTVLMNVCQRPCDPAHRLDDIIQFLAMNGANLNARNHKGDTALMIAINGKQTCKVTKLLSLGASINVPNLSGETPLMLACQLNDASTVYRLLDFGADFHAHSLHGRTALDFAMEAAQQRRRYDCVQALEKRIKKIMDTFNRQLRSVLPQKAYIHGQLFPLHCYALSESNAFRVMFEFDAEPDTIPKDVFPIAAIAMCRLSSNNQVDVRFWGPSPVENVRCNENTLDSVTGGGKYLIALRHLKKGLNELIITCKNDCKKSQQKLLIHAFSMSM